MRSGRTGSCNGWQFSELVPFAPSSQGLGLARIADHPVDGWMTRRDVVYFFVHRNVPGIASNGSSLVRHAVPLLALREYTQNATRAMPSCSHLDCCMLLVLDSVSALIYRTALC